MVSQFFVNLFSKSTAADLLYVGKLIWFQMYYRVHTVILKHLMKYPPDSEEIDYKLFITSIVEAAFIPFVLRVEKGQETKLE